MKLYITIYLWSQAVLLQTTGITSPLVIAQVSRLVNAGFFVATFLLVLLSINRITHNRWLRGYMQVMLVLVPLLAISPLLMYFQIGRLNEIVEVTRLYSWLLLIPLAAIAFDRPDSIRQLRMALLGAWLIIVLGLLAANLTGFGATAYGLGHFYLGGVQNEATISLTLGMLGLALVVPFRDRKQFRLGWIGGVAIAVCFLLVLLVLKRSVILAMPLAFAVTGVLLWKSRQLPVSRGKILGLMVAGLVIVVGGILYLASARPDLVESRSRDFAKYEETGEVEYLGAGRLYLMSVYLDLYKRTGIVKQMFGQFPERGAVQHREGYLNMPMSHPHNDYMDVLLRGGLVSMLLLFAVLFRMFWAILREARRPHGEVSGYLAAVTAGMIFFYLTQSFSGTLFRLQVMSFLAVMLGATFGTMAHARRTARRAERQPEAMPIPAQPSAEMA